MLQMTQQNKPVKKVIKKKRRKKSKVYFGTPVQEAIIRYNECSNPAIRNRIYQEHIHAAFEKMAENLIHTFKFYYFDYPFEEVKAEVVSFLVMQMPKYKADKGRAFSYFSVVGKNYLILNNNNNYKKMKIHDDIVKLDYKRNVSSESVNETVNEFNSEFVLQMLEYWDKKALYIMIREMTGSNTQHITRVINEMKKYYLNMLQEFSEVGEVDTSNTGSIF
jgi:hypothetical protein